MQRWTFPPTSKVVAGQETSHDASSHIPSSHSFAMTTKSSRPKGTRAQFSRGTTLLDPDLGPLQPPTAPSGAIGRPYNAGPAERATCICVRGCPAPSRSPVSSGANFSSMLPSRAPSLRPCLPGGFPLPTFLRRSLCSLSRCLKSRLFSAEPPTLGRTDYAWQNRSCPAKPIMPQKQPFVKLCPTRDLAGARLRRG